MKPLIEIFSQGEEIINGQTVDTNAAWLSQETRQLGFIIKRHSVVGDQLDDLKALLTEIAQRVDCCICTGGLGPTQDDLTAQAVAEAFSRPLQLDSTALAQIQQFFHDRQREMAESNRKQAMLPGGSTRLDNRWGTAPGFMLQQHRCRFYFTPGVPYEMKQMYNHLIKPDLIEHFTLQPDTLVTIRTFGVGESDLQQKLQQLSFPSSVQLGFRTLADENQIKLLFPAEFDNAQMERLTEDTVTLVGDAVFAIDGLSQQQGSLVETIHQLMQTQQLRLSVLETISQGMIAAKCFNRDWLHSAQFKNSLTLVASELMLSTQPDDLQQFAIVSSQQLQQRESTDLAMVQLFTGSSVQLDDNRHSITIVQALATPQGVICQQNTVSGSAYRKQHQAALIALDLLRRFLQNKCH